MDEILEKVADLVSTLVIAVKESEEKNTLFGDMVPAAEMIRKSADGMAQAAQTIIGEIHEEFKAQLENTADDLTVASNGLVTAAKQARAEPMNRSPQKLAIRYAKQVLERVVHLVLIEDQSNIKSLVMIGKRAGEESVRLIEAGSAQSLQFLLPDIKALQDNFCKRAELRAEGSKNMDFVSRIQGACTIIRTTAPSHFRNVARVVSEPDNASFKKDAQVDCNTILNAIDEVIIVVRQMFAHNSQFVDAAFKWMPISTIAEDTVRAATKELHDKLTTLNKYINAGQGAQEARAVVSAANRAIDAAQSVASTTNDPVKHDMILQTVEHLQKLKPQVIAAIKPVMDDPQDAEAVRQLDELIRNAQLATSALAATVALTPAQALATSATQPGYLSRSKDNLAEAVKKGDAKAIKTALGNATDALDRHIDLATTWANAIEDPEEKKEALEQIKKLKELRDQIVETGKALVENPTDAKLAARMAELIGKAKANASSMTTPSEIAAAMSKQISNNLDLLQDCIKRGDKYMAYEGLALAKNIANDIRKQMEAAEAFAATITDPVRRQQVLDAIKRLKEISPQLMEAIKYALENPNDPAAQARLRNLIEQTKRAAADLASVAQLTTQEEMEVKLRAEEARRKKVSAQAKQNDAQVQRIKVEGPVNQAVLMAAQQMEDALMSKAHDSSPLGQLVSQSHAIAEEMAKLSMFAAQGNVKDMIMSARKIREAVTAVIENAKKIAEECTDPRLKADALNYANAITSFSTQLKIITSVKSAEETMNQATENQLVTCAQGLASSVIRAVRAAEAAAIRSALRKPTTSPLKK